MGSVYQIILVGLVFLSIALPTYAQTSSGAPVSASIPSQSIVGDNQAPSPPVLLRPSDGTVTSDQRPEFAWKESSDPNGNTVLYTLYLDGEAKFLGINNLGNSAGVGYTSRLEGGEVRLLPTLKLTEGSHDWYVVAYDLSQNESYSTSWHFVVDLTPPALTLLDLESSHLPDLSSNPIFDIQAPQQVDFTISTESYATVTLTIVNSQGVSITTLNSTANHTGIIYFSYYLDQGSYSILINAVDRAGLTSALPLFSLNLYRLNISLPSLPPIIRPPLGLPPQIVLPPPPSVPSLPVTVAKLTSRGYLAIISPILLASIIPLLLFIIWRRRYNLTLLSSDLQPIDYADIYYSHPRYQGNRHHILNNIRGRTYLPYLTRYATLTIKHQDLTLILSISVKKRHYTIVI